MGQEDRVDLDLNNVAVGDIQGLENPVLKRVLLQVKKHMEETTGASESMEYSSFCLHEVFYNYSG